MKAVVAVLVVQEWHPVVDKVVPAAGTVAADQVLIGFFGVNVIGSGWCKIGCQIRDTSDHRRVVDLGALIAGPQMALADTDYNLLIKCVAGTVVGSSRGGCCGSGGRGWRRGGLLVYAASRGRVLADFGNTFMRVVTQQHTEHNRRQHQKYQFAAEQAPRLSGPAIPSVLGCSCSSGSLLGMIIRIAQEASWPDSLILKRWRTHKHLTAPLS